MISAHPALSTGEDIAIAASLGLTDIATGITPARGITALWKCPSG